ncbi:MAG: LysE family translocator [Chloroflexota bacterium]
MPEDIFLKILVIGVLAVISPGPDVFITMKNSLAYGAKGGLSTMLGILTGNTFQISFVILGFGWLTGEYPQAIVVVRVLGCIYLSWIAYKLIRYAGQNDNNVSTGEQRKIKFKEAYLMGLLTNVLNVKAIIFFVSIFSQVLTATAPATLKWICGAEMLTISTFWFSALSFLASRDTFRRFYFRFAKTFDYLFAAVLIIIVVEMLFETLFR